MKFGELTPDSIDGLQIDLVGGETLRIGPAASLYHTRPRDHSAVEQMANALMHYLSLAENNIRFCKIDAEPWTSVDEAPLSLLLDKLRSIKPSQNFSLGLHGGSHPEEASPLFFNCFMPASWTPEPVTYLSAGFSMRLLMNGKANLVSWVKEACALFDPFHGNGGFTLIANPSWAYTSDVMGQTAAILDRFPGLDYPAVPTGAFVSKTGPVCANWITILDTTLIDQMGGKDTLVQAMEALEGQALEWSNGMILVASGAPQIGDTDADLFPKAYTKVGTMIAAIRGDKNAVYFPGADDIDSIAFGSSWRGRFD